MTTLKRDNTAEEERKGSDIEGNYNNPMYQQPENYQMDTQDSNQGSTGCFDKMKSCYTNPNTPCQNYLMMFLTLVVIIVLIFLFYSLFVKQ